MSQCEWPIVGKHLTADNKNMCCFSKLLGQILHNHWECTVEIISIKFPEKSHHNCQRLKAYSKTQRFVINCDSDIGDGTSNYCSKQVWGQGVFTVCSDWDDNIPCFAVCRVDNSKNTFKFTFEV